MRLRSAASALLVCGAILLPGAPVSAKERDPGRATPPTVAYVSGPGVGVPVVLEGPSAVRMLYLTTFRGHGSAAPSVPSASVLGPPYRVRYFVPSTRGGLSFLEQDLYPCARDEAVWAFTPSGQRGMDRLAVTFSPSSGWWHSTALLRMTAGWGLRCAPASGGGAVIAGSAGGVGPPLGVWVAVAFALALVLADRASRRWIVRHLKLGGERS